MLYTPPHILADQLTLSQPLGGGTDYAHNITTPLHVFKPSATPQD